MDFVNSVAQSLCQATRNGPTRQQVERWESRAADPRDQIGNVSSDNETKSSND